MSLRSIREKPAALRASASLFALAFLFSLALSDAPRLHERIHSVLGPDHACAVTMVLSGSLEHSAAVTLSAVPPSAPLTSALISQRILTIKSALEFALLEHAPPLFA